ncbi:MAG: Gfo/Idh/MocA family oxidoreductase [Eubacteriales bacterium]|nr:Gfo/Idh/MocA family oxidoreductase [Eubacteriales bacterium]
MNKAITVAIAGCGSRGMDTYGRIIQESLKDKFQVVALADIRPERLENAREICNVPENMCFNSAEDMLKQDKLADVMFICTPDRCHYTQAKKALELNYHLLLEKPIAGKTEELLEIERLASKNKRHVVVCHVLRYTVYYQKLKEIINSGAIGKLMSIASVEGVGFWHQAHSFVRGNWANSDETSPMILQKCCHDFDTFLWLSGKHAKRVSSFGHLSYFKEENAPEGSTARCTDDCKVKNSCPYNAEDFYMQQLKNGTKGWPVNVLCLDPTEEKVLEALKTGPYGRCVFRCDNNVVDHQVVNLDMEDGLTLSFTMCAFTEQVGRTIRLMGTLGEIQGDLENNIIKVIPFKGEKQIIDISKLTEDFSGHSGGDKRMLEEFAKLLETGKSASGLISSIGDSVESHIIALAAEKSRLNDGEVVEL